MIRALTTAASGMDAQQTRMEVIANNLANVNTTGFKKDDLHFEDLLYQTLRTPGAANTRGEATPSGIQIGHGTRLSDVVKSFAPGSQLATGNPFDLAIEGRGFFRVQLQNGSYAYTRDGSFRTDGEGRVVTSAGDPLDPPLEVPPETTQVTISRDGVVTAYRADAPEGTEIGRIELADFPNPAGLLSLGHNLFRQTQASGEPILDAPGQSGIGSLSQGFLESSNVQVVEEMIRLITTQRAYELNSKVIQTADTMLQDVTRLR